MNDVERAREATERIEESVRHALRLVGPAERAIERVPEDEPTDLPAA